MLHRLHHVGLWNNYHPIAQHRNSTISPYLLPCGVDRKKVIERHQAWQEIGLFEIKCANEATQRVYAVYSVFEHLMRPLKLQKLPILMNLQDSPSNNSEQDSPTNLLLCNLPRT